MGKNWHSKEIANVFNLLQTREGGLINQEVDLKLDKYGLNKLPEMAVPSLFWIFLKQFDNFLIYVLLGSGSITFFLGEFVEAAVIFGVVIINAIIGFIQERKSYNEIRSIHKLLETKCFVLRDNFKEQLNSEKIVPGDIVFLEAGDKVPADIRIFFAHGLAVQESILTGESIPVAKNSEPLARETILAERSCMVFSGTLVISGYAKGVVVATGEKTELGKINRLVNTIEVLETPLLKNMADFAKKITITIFSLDIVLFYYGYFIYGRSFKEVFSALVGLSVALIPEGLPAVLSVVLAIGVRNMAQKKAIVRRLPAIEVLSSTTTICSDKTGTITKNQIEVKTVATAAELLDFDEILLDEIKNKINSSEQQILQEIALGSILCNTASLKQNVEGWEINGDPLEGALLVAASKIGLDYRQEQSKWFNTDIIPFESERGFMATLHHDHEINNFIFVKGAPEIILKLSKNQRSFAGDAPLDIELWSQKLDKMTNNGQRVLAIALNKVEKTKAIIEQQDLSLTFLGLIGFVDPPRAEVIKAVAEAAGAGIKVKMITGDHKKTAQFIGKQVGLRNSADSLTGSEIAKLSDLELRDQVLRHDIFARTTPEQKLRLVTALQENGENVVMTGDGVNDAPALKKADIGFAMGKRGSEIARNNAEIVLLDDNFASIVEAIKEGRAVYKNLKKVIFWTMPTNFGEAISSIIALIFNLEFIFLPLQILWINLITAVTLGMVFAFEKNNDDYIMKEKPSPKGQGFFDKSFVKVMLLAAFFFACGSFSLFIYLKQYFAVDLARTAVVNFVVTMEIIYLFTIKKFFHKELSWLDLIKFNITGRVLIVICILLQLGFIYLPWMQQIFATVGLPFAVLLLTYSSAFIIGFFIFFTTTSFL